MTHVEVLGGSRWEQKSSRVSFCKCPHYYEMNAKRGHVLRATGMFVTIGIFLLCIVSQVSFGAAAKKAKPIYNSYIVSYDQFKKLSIENKRKYIYGLQTLLSEATYKKGTPVSSILDFFLQDNLSLALLLSSPNAFAEDLGTLTRRANAIQKRIDDLKENMPALERTAPPGEVETAKSDLANAEKEQLDIIEQVAQVNDPGKTTAHGGRVDASSSKSDTASDDGYLGKHISINPSDKEYKETSDQEPGKKTLPCIYAGNVVERDPATAPCKGPSSLENIISANGKSCPVNCAKGVVCNPLIFGMKDSAEASDCPTARCVARGAHASEDCEKNSQSLGSISDLIEKNNEKIAGKEGRWDAFQIKMKEFFAVDLEARFKAATAQDPAQASRWKDLLATRDALQQKLKKLAVSINTPLDLEKIAAIEKKLPSAQPSPGIL